MTTTVGSHRGAEARTGPRWIELGRAAWGLAMLAAPRPVLEHVGGITVDQPSVAVARMLGARHLAQAALSGVDPSPEVLALGVWVDTIHALTAAALALADRSRARAGLIDMGVAAVWAGAGYRDLRADVATPPAHDRRRDRLARLVLRHAPGGAPLLHLACADRKGQTLHVS